MTLTTKTMRLANPCLSLLMTTHRQPAGYKSDKIRLKQLIAEAETRLYNMLPHSLAKGMLKMLVNAASTIDFNHLRDGLCIFVGKNLCKIKMLSFPAEDRVVIANYFANKELLIQNELENGYMFLLLSDNEARLFKSTEDSFVEVIDGIFPQKRKGANESAERLVSCSLANNAWFPGRNRGPKGRAPLPGAYPADGNGADLEHKRQFYREVDANLKLRIGKNRTKVVIFAVHEQLCLYDKLTENKESIIAEVHGNFEKLALSQVIDRAKKEIALYRDRLAEKHVTKITDNMSDGAVSFGIEEIWQLANQKPIQQLIVEEDFRFPAYVNRELRIIESADDDAIPRLDDAVEEVLFMAAASDAEIIFCKKNALTKYGRIAARFSY